MIVDYLRSCYSSKFLINATTGQTVIGRFYRPPKGAKLYTEPTIFRAGTWLDLWEQTDEPGDTLEDFTYDNGSRDFVVVDDPKRTRLAQVGCDKEFTLVPGEGGFPIPCRAVAVGELSVAWDSTGYHNTITLDDFLQGGNAFPVALTKIAENTWQAHSTDIGWDYLITAELEGSTIVLSMKATSLSGTLTATSKAEIPLVPGQVVYGPLFTALPLPWEWLDPSQPLKVILNNIS